MGKQRRNHSAAFKAKVAVEAIKSDLTAAELSAKHGVHHTLINEWKRQLLDNACDVFGKGSQRDQEKKAAERADELYRQIGQLKVENDFLSRKLDQ